MEVLEHPVALRPSIDEAAARRSLREQISRLERELGAAVCAAYPRVTAPTAGPRRAGPRMLSLGELERLRDELADRLAHLRSDLAVQAERQQAARLEIERMLLAPAEHKWVRVSNADIGQPGCKHWHVRPRLGLVGLLAGWWHVKVSSGCPLARGPRHEPRPRSSGSLVGRRGRTRAVASSPVAPPAAPRFGTEARPQAPGTRSRSSSCAPSWA